MTLTSSQKKHIRQTMRRARKQLPSRTQKRHAQWLARKLLTHPAFRFRKRVAVYLANDGEISPEYLVRALWKRGKKVYLPVLHTNKNSLWFFPFSPDTRLKLNRYNIPEPDLPRSARVLPDTLDCVLLPLVAFGRRGERLGMGGGFYDRTFASQKKPGNRKKPILIGLAHALQEHDQLPVEAWDIPLSYIATEREVIPCRPP